MIDQPNNTEWTQEFLDLRIREIQVYYNLSPRIGNKVLRALSDDFENECSLQSVRSQVMLPLDDEHRIVTYQYGMDNDNDRQLVLLSEAGCTGNAWVTKSPAVADLGLAKNAFGEWKMTPNQQGLIRADRLAMLAVPILDLSLSIAGKQNLDELPIIGTISVDTSTPLNKTGWVGEDQQKIVQSLDLILVWADVFAKLLV